MTRPLARFALACLAAAGAPLAHAFDLDSASLPPDGRFAAAQAYDRLDCGGANQSPALRWSAPPAGTRSFALTLFDPDAPGGHGWWHWLVLDLPADTRALAAGAVLPRRARVWRNSFGHAAYGGPCPPRGDAPHHYVLTLYALPTARTAVPSDDAAAQVAATLRRRALGTARLVGSYAR